jgi:SAM-dependent methyltransferase
MYEHLKRINTRPEPFEYYTAEKLWAGEHTSQQMLELHLNEEVEPASRNLAFIERSVDWMVPRFNIKTGTSLCDFGCGPGLYTTRLAQKGALVTGIDFSPRSIKYARKTAAGLNLDIDYVLQNYLEFDTDRKFDLITMIYCDLCALSPQQRKTMMGKFHDFLDDGGAVLVDVFSLQAFRNREEVTRYEPLLLGGFWSSQDYYGFLNTFKYEKEKVILDKYTIVEKNRTWEVYNWLQYFSPESTGREFEENGFKILEIFADVAGRPYTNQAEEIALVAVKA